MIHSLFLATTDGNVFMEKHWRGIIQRTAVEPVLELLRKSTNFTHVAPIIPSHKNFLISIVRENVFYIAVVQRDVPPLYVIEFLNRVADTLKSYFETCSEHTIKEHFVTVYELLEEMCDNGFPMTTEACVLKDVVAIPSLIGDIISSVTGDAQSNISSNGLPSGTMSNVPWRRGGVVYATNEVFFDIIETLDQVLDKTGRPVSTDVTGSIMCKTKLSGMPDLLMTLQNSRLLEDLAFHPCVRLKRWERESVLSFIPPDGRFELASYVANTQGGSFQTPVILDPCFTMENDFIHFEITAKMNKLGGKLPSEVVVNIPFPPNTQTVDCDTDDRGAYNYDIKQRVLRWQVQSNTVIGKATSLAGGINSSNVGGRKIGFQKMYIKGTARLSEGVVVSKPSVSVQFITRGSLLSGLKVNSVTLKSESYNVFKGIKLLTKAGRVQHRT